MSTGPTWWDRWLEDNRPKLTVENFNPMYDSERSKILIRQTASAGDRATLAEVMLANQLAWADSKVAILEMNLGRADTEIWHLKNGGAKPHEEVVEPRRTVGDKPDEDDTLAE